MLVGEPLRRLGRRGLAGGGPGSSAADFHSGGFPAGVGFEVSKVSQRALALSLSLSRSLALCLLLVDQM